MNDDLWPPPPRPNPLLPAELLRAAGAAHASVEVELELLDAKGAVIHRDRLSLEVRAPSSVHRRTFVSAIWICSQRTERLFTHPTIFIRRSRANFSNAPDTATTIWLMSAFIPSATGLYLVNCSMLSNLQ